MNTSSGYQTTVEKHIADRAEKTASDDALVITVCCVAIVIIVALAGRYFSRK